MPHKPQLDSDSQKIVSYLKKLRTNRQRQELNRYVESLYSLLPPSQADKLLQLAHVRSVCAHGPIHAPGTGIH